MNHIELGVKYPVVAGFRKLSWFEMAFSFGKGFFGLAGVVWLIIEILGFIDPARQAEIKPYAIYVFLLPGFLLGAISVYKASEGKSPFRPIRHEIPSLGTFVEIIIGDLFKIDGDLIIPASRTFDTSKEDDAIDSNSILGQFIDRNYSHPSHVDSDLDKELQKLTPEKVLSQNEKTFGRRKLFSLGQCIKLDYHGKRAYLMALTQYNAHKTSSATPEDLEIALPRMWKSIGDLGRKEVLLTPVIGGGRARVQSSHMSKIQALVRTYVAECRIKSFSKGLRIVLHADDVVQGRIAYEKLLHFLECEQCYH